ncbi:MAG: Y-family DNA polymerase [Burkholderiales bacterium]
MHWVALHFPRFRHQALSRGHAPPEPEREALEAVAAWACQFTPRVSLEPPREILLEVEGSLHYFGGRWKLLARLRAGLTALGFEARVAEAPAARAALWLARGGSSRLETLPVAVTGLAPGPLELLASLGVQSIGGLMRLPRDSVVRRFGQRLLDEMDQARGGAAEARDFFAPPACFSARLQLPAPVSYAQAMLFATGRLLRQMEGFLTARHAGVRDFCLELQHEGLAPTQLQVKLASPVRDEKHLTRLLRERLGALVLKAPIEAILLTAAELAFLPGTNGHLLRDAQSGGEAWLRLVERLQSRLGYDAVYGLDTREDHRPERAFEIENPGSREKKKDGLNESAGARPLWLLEPPRRLRENDFSLLAGPERIDSGWWDGDEAKRDYFIARTGECSLAWIYREREGGWFLHGLFA